MKCLRVLGLFLVTGLLNAAFGQPRVNGFTLVNANTNMDIAELSQHMVIDFGSAGHALNIRANTDPAVVGSVLFKVNGVRVRTENVAPYALGGDAPAGDYFAYDFKPGELTICAIAYSGAGATGQGGMENCITLKFEGDSGPVIIPPAYDELDFWGEKLTIPIAAYDPGGGKLRFSAEGLPPGLSVDPESGIVQGILALENEFGSSTGFEATITVTNARGAQASTSLNFFILHPNIESFTLIDTNTGLPVPGFDPIPYNGTIDLSRTGSRLNIRANPSIPEFFGGSVIFEWDGQRVRAENVSPYALGGDYPVGVYQDFPLTLGEHEVRAAIVSGYNGSGGFSFYGYSSIFFRVVDEVASEPQTAAYVYPNPAADYIRLPGDSKYGDYTITGSFNTVMVKGKMAGQNIDVSLLPPGLYLLQMNQGGVISRYKFFRK